MKAIYIRNLIKTYPNEITAVKGISLDVEQGDFFALLGPNGAGKSTIINILTSLVRKTSGKVEIFGIDIDENFSLAKQYIGVVPQEFNFNIFETVHQILLNQAGFYGIPRGKALKKTQKYLEHLGLWERRNSIARSLSGGMKRRLMIARALVHEPKMLVLDEPTAGVDIEIRRSMWHYLLQLNQQGITIILTTHYLEEAEYLCRNIAIIDQGKIIEHSAMSDLLRKLDQESFILYLEEPYQIVPKIEGYIIKPLDNRTIEVEVPRDQGITNLFNQLNMQSIKVISMRNKVNRLEELFIKLTATQ